MVDGPAWTRVEWKESVEDVAVVEPEPSEVEELAFR